MVPPELPDVNNPQYPSVVKITAFTVMKDLFITPFLTI
jgi:hypothetical protein